MSNFSYEEVAKILDSYGAQGIGESGYRVNYLFFNALNELFDHSLTCAEIVQIVDHYNDVALGKLPKVALFSSDDYISGLCRLMTEDPLLCRFSLEKREIFAFCIYCSCRMLTFDEEKQKIVSGITLLSSLEKIMDNYTCMKENDPGLFPSQNQEEPPSEEHYGYSADNPIRMVSIHNSYEYLKRLQAEDGEIVSCRRRGSTIGRLGHLIDIYEIQVRKTSFLFSSKTETFEIYIDPYSQNASYIAPEHFKLR